MCKNFYSLRVAWHQTERHRSIFCSSTMSVIRITDNTSSTAVRSNTSWRNAQLLTLLSSRPITSTAHRSIIVYIFSIRKQYKYQHSLLNKTLSIYFYSSWSYTFVVTSPLWFSLWVVSFFVVSSYTKDDTSYCRVTFWRIDP